MKVLNVGSADTRLTLPTDWVQHNLDIDERYNPEVVGDMRHLLDVLSPSSYDVIYASHVIEHVYPHEVLPMLREWRKVAREWVHIKCPDVQACAVSIAQGIDITDTLYVAPVGAISAGDLIYGYAQHIQNISEWYAHKTGFTKRSLETVLRKAGYHDISITQNTGMWELEAVALC